MPGDATDESLPDPETPPEDVFGALGNKKRIHILWALHEAFREGPPDTLLFSELYSRLTIEINSSQLNYHLKHLIGNFVRKTDDGYELSTAGRHLCEALRKGIFDQPQKRMSADAGFDCHFCNKGVEATFNYCRFPVHPTFNQGYIYIQCPSCEYIYVGNIIEVPYEAFIDEKAAFTQFQKYTHHKILAFARGICMICGYEVGAEFHAAEEIPLPIFDHRDKVGIDRSCDHCGTRLYLPIGASLLSDSELTSFCYEHGVDVLSTPSWELEFAGTDKYVTVLSRNPWKVALQVTFDDDTLEIVVDGDLTVISRNKR